MTGRILLILLSTSSSNQRIPGAIDRPFWRFLKLNATSWWLASTWAFAMKCQRARLPLTRRSADGGAASYVAAEAREMGMREKTGGAVESVGAIGVSRIPE